jgi:hypothetical protein
MSKSFDRIRDAIDSFLCMNHIVWILPLIVGIAIFGVAVLCGFVFGFFFLR